MIIAVLALLGLCFGSFINALVWRLYLKEGSKKHKFKNNKDAAKYSVLKGRSMCPNCQHQLATSDLIPVISWLFLKGKCRYCKHVISWQYPVVELLTTVLFVASYLYWPTKFVASWQYVGFASWLIILVGLIALVVYDIKWMILPDKIIFSLTSVALIALIIQLIMGRPISDIYGIVWSVIIGGGVFWLIYQISKGKWIGGGDVKLGLLLGLIVAKPEYSFLTLFMASVIAMLFTLPFLIAKKLKKDSKIPFGPFLIIACVVVVMFGSNILDAYKSLFGL